MNVYKRVRVAYLDYVSILVHRVLSQHRAGELCDSCPVPCVHCGTVGLIGEDHSCPCPYSDADCPYHVLDTVTEEATHE